jgi:hypothetical protein
LLFVVCCLLFVVCCLLFAVCCLCLLLVVCFIFLPHYQAIYGVPVAGVCTFYHNTITLLHMGKAFGDDTAQHTKLTTALNAVIARWYRHTHKQQLLVLYGVLGADSWSVCVYNVNNNHHNNGNNNATNNNSNNGYDPQTHNPLLLGTWSNPFENSNYNILNKSANNNVDDDDSDDEPLNVEDGSSANAQSLTSSQPQANNAVWEVIQQVCVCVCVCVCSLTYFNRLFIMRSCCVKRVHH